MFWGNGGGRYGKIFKTSVAGRAVVMSVDPDFNHFILQQEGKLVELWYMDSFAELVGQRGPLKEAAVAGNLHKNLKKLIQEHIGIESLKGELFGLVDQVMTMDLSFGIMLGYDPLNTDPNLSKMFTEFRRGMLSFPLKLPGTVLHSCLQNQKKIITMIMNTMKSKRDQQCDSSSSSSAAETGTNYDMLDRLIDDKKIQTSMNDRAIGYVIFALLFANGEALPSVLMLVMKLLLANPLAMEELVVINEILRINGSIGLIRRAIDDIYVNGYVIPKGWTIAVMSTAVQLNPDFYDDPLSFNPWRWKGANASSKTFIPFGGGMRTCVGADYSKVLMAIFVHNLVTKYRCASCCALEFRLEP
ncbi:unnamed protein product [Linum tenue]|uniref:Cytochrome P450 n=1 Tax=Linum tenue TaxID=586396 RepID=A0AAV0IEK6_9ROSI|nr:unnamed protein product [Linum tenue]